MQQVESWAHHGTMDQQAEDAAGGSGTVDEEEVLQVTDTDSEDEPIVKEEAGPKPKLLLNPYFVDK